jgi:acetyl-CoA acetyltransferase
VSPDGLRGSCVIAGVGHTAFGRLGDRTTTAMNVEACRKALEDAGIDKAAVDGLFVKYPTSSFEFMYGQKVAEALGIQPRVGGVWDQGGAANISQIGFACMSIQAGLCSVALVCFADNPKSGTRQAYQRVRGDNDAPYGWFGIPAAYAMVARRHMEEFGTTSEQLAEIAVVCRANGARNPSAQLRQPITVADHQASPWIAEPLHRDDCCLVSDGGAAVVVMSAGRARELQVPAPVPILGFGQGQTSWEVAQRPVLTETCARQSGETAFAMAGINPADVDVCELYDCFTIVPLMTLEDYGFCAKGEGGAFVQGGRIALDGDLPINTSGGLLSETGMPGMQHVIEGVRQVRGTSVNQVKGAGVVVISNQGGIMHTHSTLVLGG